MDQELIDHGREAIRLLNRVIEAGTELEHHDLNAASTCVIAFRNRAIELFPEGRASRACLDRANSLTSLSFGGEFPLSGLHLHRLEQTRDGMERLIEGPGDG